MLGRYIHGARGIRWSKLLIGLALIGSCVWSAAVIEAMTPLSRSEATAQFGMQPSRALLVYKVWQDQPYILFTMAHSDHLYFDRLVLDPWSMEIPPLPQWPWSGERAYIEQTDQPASLGVAQ